MQVYVVFVCMCVCVCVRKTLHPHHSNSVVVCDCMYIHMYLSYICTVWLCQLNNITLERDFHTKGHPSEQL